MLAIVPWGPVKGNEDLQIPEGFASRGYLTSKPVQYKAGEPPVKWKTETFDSPAALDPNHSHFIFVSRLPSGGPRDPQSSTTKCVPVDTAGYFQGALSTFSFIALVCVVILLVSIAVVHVGHRPHQVKRSHLEIMILIPYLPPIPQWVSGLCVRAKFCGPHHSIL